MIMGLKPQLQEYLKMNICQIIEAQMEDIHRKTEIILMNMGVALAQLMLNLAIFSLKLCDVSAISR